MKKEYKKAIAWIVITTAIIFAGFGPIAYAIEHDKMSIWQIIYVLLITDLGVLLIGLIAYLLHKLCKCADL